ncbi:MAG TPA: NADH-quinone oxidoreductase subunit C [Nitrospiraceae bacterium]|jgi:Ni,Fe-hydrogenase III large subunit/Ni,Fe-hydrogenase III component G|nr:NADH-quinone oxidoreductase subunit C [Nitrospiraceae bacterium]
MADAKAAVALLQQAFPSAVVGTGEVHGKPLVRLQVDQVPLVAHYLHTKPDLRGSLSLLWAVDHRPREARYELLYLFTLEERRDWVVLATELLGNSRQFRSITPSVHAAKWYEREIRDMFGLIPVGHPDMRRLVRHEHWPKGTHPLKKDFRWDTVLARAQGQYAFRHIEGEGVFEVPVGPIHAGIIEPGHFRFSVAGEPIMQLEVRHFWKHRGVEKLFEQMTLTDAVSLAERVSGDTTVGHGLAYCQAAETLLGIEVPPRARYLRSLFLELERIHNHLGDVGAICNDTAYALAHAHCGRMKERILQLNDRLAGSRFLRGVICPGGVGLDLSERQLEDVVAELDAIEPDFAELERILFANASLTDRLETTGVLTEQIAWDHAVVGVVGRASGIDRDIRRDRPFAAYTELQPKVALYRYGDVRARMRVRMDEIHESMRLIREIRRRIPSGLVTATPSRTPGAGEWALSAVEGWRGEILYMVMAGTGGRIHRCKVRDPSFVNWPAIQWAVLGNIIPDFPLINKSFNLSYAGNDL